MRPGLLRVVVRRAYAGEAAAAQTGVGSPTTRGLIAAIRRSAGSPVGRDRRRGPPRPTLDEIGASLVAPPWMRTLAAVLAVEGWRVAGAAAARGDGVRGRGGPVRAAVPVGDGRPPHRGTGRDLVGAGPADLRLRPGCQPESRTPGVSVQIDLLGAAGIRGNPELMRIVDGRGGGPAGAHRAATVEGGGMTVVAADAAETADGRRAGTVWIRMPMSGSGACPRPARSR